MRSSLHAGMGSTAAAGDHATPPVTPLSTTGPTGAWQDNTSATLGISAAEAAATRWPDATPSGGQAAQEQSPIGSSVWQATSQYPSASPAPGQPGAGSSMTASDASAMSAAPAAATVGTAIGVDSGPASAHDTQSGNAGMNYYMDRAAASLSKAAIADGAPPAAAKQASTAVAAALKTHLMDLPKAGTAGTTGSTAAATAEGRTVASEGHNGPVRQETAAAHGVSATPSKADNSTNASQATPSTAGFAAGTAAPIEVGQDATVGSKSAESATSTNNSTSASAGLTDSTPAHGGAAVSGTQAASLPGGGLQADAQNQYAEQAGQAISRAVQEKGISSSHIAPVAAAASAAVAQHLAATSEQPEAQSRGIFDSSCEGVLPQHPMLGQSHRFLRNGVMGKSNADMRGVSSDCTELLLWQLTSPRVFSPACIQIWVSSDHVEQVVWLETAQGACLFSLLNWANMQLCMCLKSPCWSLPPVS